MLSQKVARFPQLCEARPKGKSNSAILEHVRPEFDLPFDRLVLDRLPQSLFYSQRLRYRLVDLWETRSLLASSALTDISVFFDSVSTRNSQTIPTSNPMAFFHFYLARPYAFTAGQVQIGAHRRIAVVQDSTSTRTVVSEVHANCAANGDVWPNSTAMAGIAFSPKCTPAMEPAGRLSASGPPLLSTPLKERVIVLR